MARKVMTTSIELELQKEIKKLAIDLERPFNNLLEEAIRDLLKKYRKEVTNKLPKIPWEIPFAGIPIGPPKRSEVIRRLIENAHERYEKNKTKG